MPGARERQLESLRGRARGEIDRPGTREGGLGHDRAPEAVRHPVGRIDVDAGLGADREPAVGDVGLDAVEQVVVGLDLDLTVGAGAEQDRVHWPRFQPPLRAHQSGAHGG